MFVAPQQYIYMHITCCDHMKATIDQASPTYAQTVGNMKEFMINCNQLIIRLNCHR